MLCRFEAIIFDLDGTLIDSAPDISACVNRMLLEFGCEPLNQSEITSFVGNGVPKLVQRSLRAAGAGNEIDHERAIAVLKALYAEGNIDNINLYPGVLGLLSSLRDGGVVMGICTNRPKYLAELLLKKLDLSPYFSAVVGGDSCDKPKPDPAPLIFCFEQIGVEIASGIFVGDSEADEQTAINANVRFALFTKGYRKKHTDNFRCEKQFSDHKAFQEYLFEIPPSE